MATEQTIWFNYEQALSRANDLETIANDLKSISTSSLEDALDHISANWTGDNARQYRNKGVVLQEQIKTSVSDLLQIASEIRRIAKTLYDTEMHNLAIAQEREY